MLIMYMFQIHHLHCYSSPVKFDHYYDVMPLLYHMCNIFMQVIKRVFSKLMKIVIPGAHRETMASNLIVNVIVHCRRTSTTLFPWQIAKIDSPTATF